MAAAAVVQTLPISVPVPARDNVDSILSSPVASLRLTGSLPRRSAPSSATVLATEQDVDQGEIILPSLPPLHQSAPDALMRHNISLAMDLAADGEPDSEKAFFVADLSVVYKAWKRWTTELPEIQPFYAVKCNPDPYVLRLLAALGTGFDCASNNEIKAVLSLSPPSKPAVDPSSRIIFANPCKASSFIRSAAKQGVHMMTFDNADELHKIKRTDPHAKLVLRILTDDSKSLCQLGLKFGAPLSSVSPLLNLAKELGLDVIGVAFHVGSGNSDPTSYISAIALARTVFNIASSIGFKFTLLDIGGGFEDHLFEDSAKCIRQGLDEWFPDRLTAGEENAEGKVKVISEPGRFFVGSAFKLATCVIARRLVEDKVEDDKDAEEKAKVMYYINDGVYGSFNCTMFDHQVVHPYPLTISQLPILPSSPSATAAMLPSSIWGPTCDSIDLVSPLSHLPSEMEVGDWLGWDNMGAYTICAASGFNGFSVGKVVYTVNSDNDADGEGEVVRTVLRRWAEKVGSF